MHSYTSNPRCGCSHCRMAGMMVPAVLITLGVLFLVMEFQAIAIQKTWPVLLIVIGLVKLLQYRAPTAGHVAIGHSSGAAPSPYEDEFSEPAVVAASVLDLGGSSTALSDSPQHGEAAIPRVH